MLGHLIFPSKEMLTLLKCSTDVNYYQIYHYPSSPNYESSFRLLLIEMCAQKVTEEIKYPHYYGHTTLLVVLDIFIWTTYDRL